MAQKTVEVVDVGQGTPVANASAGSKTEQLDSVNLKVESDPLDNKLARFQSNRERLVSKYKTKKRSPRDQLSDSDESRQREISSSDISDSDVSSTPSPFSSPCIVKLKAEFGVINNGEVGNVGSDSKSIACISEKSTAEEEHQRHYSDRNANPDACSSTYDCATKTKHGVLSEPTEENIRTISSSVTCSGDAGTGNFVFDTDVTESNNKCAGVPVTDVVICATEFQADPWETSESEQDDHSGKKRSVDPTIKLILERLRCRVVVSPVSSVVTDGGDSWFQHGQRWHLNADDNGSCSPEPEEVTSCFSEQGTPQRRVVITDMFSEESANPSSLVENCNENMASEVSSSLSANSSSRKTSQSKNSYEKEHVPSFEADSWVEDPLPERNCIMQVDDVSASLCAKYSPVKLCSNRDPKAKAVVDQTGDSARRNLCSDVESLSQKKGLGNIGVMNDSSSKDLCSDGEPSSETRKVQEKESEMLPDLMTSARLGLSPVSEADWDAGELQIDAPKESHDVEDLDVLSLYEYDTFSEFDEPGHARFHLELAEFDEPSHAAQQAKSDIPARTKSAERSDYFVKKRAVSEQTSEGNDELEEKFSCKEASSNRQEKSVDRQGKHDSPSFSPKPTTAVQRDFRPPVPPAPVAKRKGFLTVERPENQRGGSLLHKPSQSTSFTKQNNWRDLEAELQQKVVEKNIELVTELVSKLHSYGNVQVDKGLMLRTLHLLFREGAVHSLMKILTFVFNQGLFNEEVCNCYIRVGCSKHYIRQMKNIFQFLRRHSIRPAGDCCTVLLRLFHDDSDDPIMFWMALMYFESFPGFAPPVPVLEGAILNLLKAPGNEAKSKLNQWLLTTKSTACIKRLALSIIGRMASLLQPATMSRLQKILQKPEEVDDLANEEEMVLKPALGFHDQDFQYYQPQIRECGMSRDWRCLAQIFVDLCRKPGHNRPLLKEYANALLMQKELVPSVDAFLRSLHDIFQNERTKEPPPECDSLALVHVAAIALQETAFKCPPGLTMTLLEVILQCPLISKKLLLNCGDTGLCVVEAAVKCRRAAQACDILKDARLRNQNQRHSAFVTELLRQLVAEGNITAAFGVLNTVFQHSAVGVAELSVLSIQLIWHALSLGNVTVALDIYDLRQKLVAPPSPVPVPVLRALLTAASQAGLDQRTEELFTVLKLLKVYNADIFTAHPFVFQLSTMLTPSEMRLCVLDRLKELYHKLCSTVASGGALTVLDRGLAVQFVPEHNPALLALPFLALAPRSQEQAMNVLCQDVFTQISPSLRSAASGPNRLTVVDQASLVFNLKDYDCKHLKQGLTWADEATLLADYPAKGQDSSKSTSGRFDDKGITSPSFKRPYSVNQRSDSKIHQKLSGLTGYPSKGLDSPSPTSSTSFEQLPPSFKRPQSVQATQQSFKPQQKPSGFQPILHKSGGDGSPKHFPKQNYEAGPSGSFGLSDEPFNAPRSPGFTGPHSVGLAQQISKPQQKPSGFQAGMHGPGRVTSPIKSFPNQKYKAGPSSPSKWKQQHKFKNERPQQRPQPYRNTSPQKQQQYQTSSPPTFKQPVQFHQQEQELKSPTKRTYAATYKDGSAEPPFKQPRHFAQEKPEFGESEMHTKQTFSQNYKGSHSSRPPQQPAPFLQSPEPSPSAKQAYQSKELFPKQAKSFSVQQQLEDDHYEPWRRRLTHPPNYQGTRSETSKQSNETEFKSPLPPLPEFFHTSGGQTAHQARRPFGMSRGAYHGPPTNLARNDPGPSSASYDRPTDQRSNFVDQNRPSTSYQNNPSASRGGYKPLQNRGGYKPPSNQGGYKPSPNRGGYKPPPNRGGYKPSPNRGGYKQPPNHGGYKPPPNRGGYKPPPSPNRGGFGFKLRDVAFNGK